MKHGDWRDPWSYSIPIDCQYYPVFFELVQVREIEFRFFGPEDGPMDTPNVGPYEEREICRVFVPIDFDACRVPNLMRCV